MGYRTVLRMVRILGVLVLISACQFEPEYGEDLFTCDLYGEGQDCPDGMSCFRRPTSEPRCCIDSNCGHAQATGGQGQNQPDGIGGSGAFVGNDDRRLGK